MDQIKQYVNPIIYFCQYVDERGTLFPINFNELPFIPKRVFMIDQVPEGIIRGEHAHRVCKQFFVCLSGNISLVMHDGLVGTTIHLHPTQGIYIPPMYWSSQMFFNNASALVLASESYDEDDYIRNFEQFLKEV